MSDAKQDFIDEVMHLVELLRHADMIERDSIRSDCSAITIRAEKRLHDFLQERIGEPVRYTDAIQDVFSPEEDGDVNIPLYRLDGEQK